jgi:hypothetical protein
VTEQRTVVVLEHEPWPGISGHPNGRGTDIRLLNTALHAGMKRYPWLKDLLPQRPADAQTCSACNGTGQFPVADLICSCGGAGWVGCPITALGGTTDPLTPQVAIAAWAMHTQKRFDAHLLPGGHFFISQARRAVLGMVADSLR